MNELKRMAVFSNYAPLAVTPDELQAMAANTTGERQRTMHACTFCACHALALVSWKVSLRIALQRKSWACSLWAAALIAEYSP